MKPIDERIATLIAEKTETLNEYKNCSDEMQDILAERNMRINLELKFLSELKQAIVIGRSELLFAFLNYCDEAGWIKNVDKKRIVDDYEKANNSQ